MTEKVFQHQAELLLAYQEVLLVAPPNVLAGVDEVLTLCGTVGEIFMETGKSAEFTETAEGTIAALRRLTLAVRVDLAYEPRRWQLWRTLPRWWATRQERRAVEARQRLELESGEAAARA